MPCCGGAKYVPGGGEPLAAFEVESDGAIVATVSQAEGGLVEALRQVGELQDAGHAAKAFAVRG